MNIDINNYDVVIVGAGFSGSILARLIAEEKKKRVLLIEKRDHIAGNMYDFYSEGILVQKYGPHTFHTNKRHIFDFIQKFIEMQPYSLTYRAILKGIPVPCPFNLDTIEQIYSKEEAQHLIVELEKAFPNRVSIPIFELLESDNRAIKDYARMLFEEDFKPYTSKQWGKFPEEIDESILKRVPIILNRRDTYFDDLYEVLPKGGFTELFKSILNHPNITVKLNEDA